MSRPPSVVSRMSRLRSRGVQPRSAARPPRGPPRCRRRQVAATTHHKERHQGHPVVRVGNREGAQGGIEEVVQREHRRHRRGHRTTRCADDATKRTTSRKDRPPVVGCSRDRRSTVVTTASTAIATPTCPALERNARCRLAAVPPCFRGGPVIGSPAVSSARPAGRRVRGTIARPYTGRSMSSASTTCPSKGRRFRSVC